MKKLLLTLGLILLMWGEAKAEFVRANCSSLTSPQTGMICSQTTVAGGRDPGVYRWDGAAWVTVGGGHVFEDEGTPVSQRTNANFTGGGVTVSDSGGKTVINIPGGGAPGFDTITGGTNTTAAMVVGSGGSLAVSGTGTITPQYTPSGGIAATTVQGAIAELDTEKQPIDSDLTALSASACTGLWVVTGVGTGICRNITGATNKITVSSNPGGVGGNPALTTGADVVDRTQANTYSGGGLQDMSANELRIFNQAGYAPTASGRIGVNTTNNKPVIGLNGATQNLAIESGNIATATALAGVPGGCTTSQGQFSFGIQANGTSNCETPTKGQANAPSPNTCLYIGQIHHDGRAFQPGVQGYTYVCYTAGGTPATLLSQVDGITTFSDGVNTYSPVGPDTAAARGTSGVKIQRFRFTGAFTNQPSNDGVEIISSAADTAWTRYCGTLNGGNDKDLTCEIKQLNGTTPVSSTASNFKNMYSFQICSDNTCDVNATSANTVTLRKATGDGTITTITTGNSRAANQHFDLHSISSSFDINGLTENTAPSSSADFLAMYITGAGANRKVKPENLIQTFEINFPAVSCDQTVGTLQLDTVDANKPTAVCGAGSTNTTLIRGVASFPDTDGDFSVQSWFDLPQIWVGAIDTIIRWRTSGTTGNVAWQLSTVCMTDNELDDIAWNTAQVITDAANGTANRLNNVTQTSITTTGCAAGEKFRWKLVRNRTHASDTIGAFSVELDGIKFIGRREMGS